MSELDEQLVWKNNLDSFASKVSKGIGMLRRMKKFVPQQTLISVYNAIILPHFDYCSLVWDNCYNYSLEKLQKLQNRAARVITGKSYEVRSNDIPRDLNWQPLMERWKEKKVICMYKVRNGCFVENMTSMFNVADNKNYSLRCNNIDYSLDKPKTNFFLKKYKLFGW